MLTMQRSERRIFTLYVIWVRVSVTVADMCRNG